MWVRLYFLFFGLVNVITLLVQLSSSSNIVNFFSFFTVLGNIFVTIFFFFFGLNKEKKLSTVTEFLFGATVVYMIIVGSGYWLLLRDVTSLTAFPWINIQLHLLMPIVSFIGWLIYPHHNRLQFRHAFLWLIFPIIYLLYSLIRGVFTEWYPYPFLNPNSVEGYIGVLHYVILLSVTTYSVGLGVIWIENKLLKRK